MQDPLRPIIDRLVGELVAAVREALERALLPERPAAPAPLPGRRRQRKRKTLGSRARAAPSAKLAEDRARAASQRAQILSLLAPGHGLSLGEILRATGLSSKRVRYGLRVLRAEGQVVLTGTRKHARWAVAPAVRATERAG